MNESWLAPYNAVVNSGTRLKAVMSDANNFFDKLWRKLYAGVLKQRLSATEPTNAPLVISLNDLIPDMTDGERSSDELFYFAGDELHFNRMFLVHRLVDASNNENNGVRLEVSVKRRDITVTVYPSE